MNHYLALILLFVGVVGCTKAPALKVYSLNVPSIKGLHSRNYVGKSIKVSYPQSLKDEMSQKMHFSS